MSIGYSVSGCGTASSRVIESLTDNCAFADQSVGEVERTVHAQVSGRESITRQLAVLHPLHSSCGMPYSKSL